MMRLIRLSLVVPRETVSKTIISYKEQKRKYLVPAASDKMIFSHALTEPRIGSDAKNIETTAVLDDGGEFYILNFHHMLLGDQRFLSTLMPPWPSN